MKKLVLLLIPLIILIIANSCQETPTESLTESLTGVENFNSTDLHDAYLKKMKTFGGEMSFEEFKGKIEKYRSLRKSAFNMFRAPSVPDGWEGDPSNPATYGEDLVMDNDDHWISETIDFEFSFYGTPYTEIHISDNGYLTLGSHPSYHAYWMPLWGGPPTIAVLLGDFYPEYDIDLEKIYTKTIGDPGDRIYVVTWVNYLLFNGSWTEYSVDDVNTFQVQLFEKDNKIQLSYLQLNNDGIQWFGDIEAGLSPNNQVEDVVWIAVGDQIPALHGQSICFDPALDYVVSPGSCKEAPVLKLISPQQKLIEASEALEDILDEGEFHKKKMTKVLDKAIKEINKSLDYKNWIGNELHPKHGKKAFDHIKHAVKELRHFERSKDAGSKAAVRKVIATLVSVAMRFAESAMAELDETYCGDTSKCGKERGKAYKEFKKAEEEEAKYHWDHAIDKYKKAWEHALKALKHWEGP